MSIVIIDRVVLVIGTLFAVMITAVLAMNVAARGVAILLTVPEGVVAATMAAAWWIFLNEWREQADTR